MKSASISELGMTNRVPSLVIGITNGWQHDCVPSLMIGHDQSKFLGPLYNAYKLLIYFLLFSMEGQVE